MKKFCIHIIESLALFIFNIAMAFLFVFFCSYLPSWTIIFTGALLTAATCDIYALFERHHLYIPMIISGVFSLAFTLFLFLNPIFSINLKLTLCVQTAFVLICAIAYCKNIKNTYSGRFPITYKRNRDIVYNMCVTFISSLPSSHTDEILFDFEDHFNSDFDFSCEFSNRDANLYILSLKTLDTIILHLAKTPILFVTRGDDDDWHRSCSTPIGTLYSIYEKVQLCMNFKNSAQEVDKRKKLSHFINLVDDCYSKHSQKNKNIDMNTIFIDRNPFRLR